METKMESSTNVAEEDMPEMIAEYLSSFSDEDELYIASENKQQDEVKTRKKITKKTNKTKKTKVTNKKLSKKKNNAAKEKPIGDKLTLGPFTCKEKFLWAEICNEKFDSCCDYSNHYREQHQKNRRCLKCQVCEKLLRPNNPDGASAYVCQECGFDFDHEEDLQYHHNRVHNKARPHQCDVCHKRFTEKYILTTHMRIHTGEKPYKCTHCDKRFNQQSHMTVHIRTHTDDAPYRCVVCGKSFKQYGILRNHMRSHTNISPFMCRLCHRSYKERRNLLGHIEKRHGRSSNAIANDEVVKSEEISDEEYELLLVNDECE